MKKCSENIDKCLVGMDGLPWSMCSSLNAPVVSINGNYFWLIRKSSKVDGCPICHALLWLVDHNTYECLSLDHIFTYQILDLNYNKTEKLIKINCSKSLSYYQIK